MYLTRFRLNAARTGARRLLSSRQIMHAAVMASFPQLLPTDQPAPNAPRVLWRLDHNAPGEVFLFLVSPDAPDLTHLVEQAGWPTAMVDGPGWQTRSYTPLLDRLVEGGQWGFRLTANPVHHIRRTDDEPRKRTAHLTAYHQIGWLLDEGRQERGGFRILEKPKDKRLLPGGTTHQGREHHGDRYEVTVRDHRSHAFEKSRPTGARRGKPVTLVTVTFDGRLEVTDPALMRRTLTQGLGKAKAYGCGLMTLAPLTQGAVR
ncbi:MULTISPECIES: type I-E CRISPR-associated protein Cas6/Cse3/CasE [Streptomyces]|uniref:CRISPR-associated protein Cse3 n=1 Tax=Streptomyces viridochromogenes TaxID=1938 RepID=A0A0L8L0S8_STRVR|nr:MULTISPECIES: type I-E CRISPR-associated protein Cas6/Cse3/CasE [Streptomyces]KOG31853.1 CRISPR-associated protein Cse3 [Streptomyces viridochromogenes]